LLNSDKVRRDLQPRTDGDDEAREDGAA